MIQRIQSIYLLLAVAMLGLEYTFDSVWKGPSAEAYSWFVPVTTGVFTLAAIGALGAIFLYSQRKRQRSLVVVSQVIALLGSSHFIWNAVYDELASSCSCFGSYV